MNHKTLLLLVPVLLLVGSVSALGDDMLLIVEKPPADGLVVAQVDLTAAARYCNLVADPAVLQATTVVDGKQVPIQLIPDEDFQSQNHCSGTVVIQLPPASDGRVRLKIASTAVPTKPWDGIVRLPGVSLRHDAKQQGGFPSEINSPMERSSTSCDGTIACIDRALGWVQPDRRSPANVTVVSRGPLCTAVRVTGRYVQANGKAPPSAPQAVYDWLYLANRPLVLVRATIRQQKTFSWPELHFLELDYPQESFPQLGRWRADERGHVHRLAEELWHAAVGRGSRWHAGHCHDAVRPGIVL